MNPLACLTARGVATLIAFAAALPASAQSLSNGTGGGDFATGSTWALGASPTTSAFKIVAGDTVTGATGLAYSASTRNNDVAGTLTINPGASIVMGRHNATLLPAETASVTQITGGTLSVSRLTGVANTHAAINVSAGSLIVRENIAVSATHYSIWLSGGLIDSVTSNYACPLFVSGGTLLMRNGVASLGGLSSGLWNGGRIAVNTSTPSGSATNSLINAWKSNAPNVLALSGKTTPQTLTLGASVSSTQGELAFSVYSSTPHDNDVFALSNAAHTLTLGTGVILRIEGVNLTGTPSSYVGKAYKLFSLASGSYAGIGPTVAPATWTINGDAYVVTFTNTLASNGTLTVASVNSVDPIVVADFNLPAQDANGWTILTPAADSRLIYIDPVNGDNTTATHYAPGATAIGANPQSPVGPVLAYKTLSAAAAVLREDQPDWLLLKAGGVWTESLDVKRGRSPSERAVVCAYGTGARPELRTGTARGIVDAQISNIIIAGIRFWAHTRDSDGPYFVGYDGTAGFSLYTRPATDARVVRDILIEDCVFRSYATNVLNGGIGETDNSTITRFVLRRSLISGNYSTTAHSQGLYHGAAGQPIQPSLLLQENTFDHNGWRIQNATASMGNKSDGQATYYNHNTYFTDAKGVILQRNLFLRAASIGNKWSSTGTAGSVKAIVIDNNLYVEGEIGIGIGGNTDGPLRFEDIRIRNNVLSDIGRSRPTNRYLSWGVEISDWNSGTFTDNLIIHQRHTGITNTYGLSFTPTFATDDILVAGNVIADLHGYTNATSGLVRFGGGALTTNVRFEDNIVQATTATPPANFTTGGYVFSGSNQYYSTAIPSKRFGVNGAFADLAAWQSATGDTGAIFAAPSFPDASRDVESYIATLGLGSTLQDFINTIHGQSKATWNPALTAPAVNNWLRAGFGLPPVY